MSEEKATCEATIEFGDDWGDNITTFHCKKEPGHVGFHAESGDMGYGVMDHPYALTWEGSTNELEVATEARFEGSEAGTESNERPAVFRGEKVR